MTATNVLIISEILGIVATLLRNKSGENETVAQVGDLLAFGVSAVRAGRNAEKSLGELRDQLTVLNVENRGPTAEELDDWRSRSGAASDRIQKAAEAGRTPGEKAADEVDGDIE